MGLVRVVKVTLYEAAQYISLRIAMLVESRWNKSPFGKSLHATREEYLRLFDHARCKSYPVIDTVECDLGYAVDRDWIDNLALHTQIVKKKSELVYSHGRLLYSLLRKRLSDPRLSYATILETGTARGFSAICMAKALYDANNDGVVISIDVLPHFTKQIWNCIDDHDGLKSRYELLTPWYDYMQRCIFIQGDTRQVLSHVSMSRIHFAFLDAQHTKRRVIHEVRYVSSRQLSGDIIFFDDVTKAIFPGVVEAVEQIEMEGEYRIRHIEISTERGYAWAQKL